MSARVISSDVRWRWIFHESNATIQFQFLRLSVNHTRACHSKYYFIIFITSNYFSSLFYVFLLTSWCLVWKNSQKKYLRRGFVFDWSLFPKLNCIFFSGWDLCFDFFFFFVNDRDQGFPIGYDTASRQHVVTIVDTAGWDISLHNSKPVSTHIRVSKDLPRGKA